MRHFILTAMVTISLAACTDTKEDLPIQIQENPPTVTEQTAQSWDQWGQAYPTWVEPIDPFKVIGNVHYVGTKGLSSFLITSDDGHVLIDGTLPQNVHQIIQNIETLGFDIGDVKTLLNSHAHFDHSGGLAALKSITGAKLIASEGDRSALEGGYYLGAEYSEDYRSPKVEVDEIVSDGDVIEVGSIRLKANITPGHSRGCTSWSMDVTHQEHTYEALFFCSATVAGNRLIPAQYDGIIADYQTTFDKTRNWRPDVFLSNHPGFFKMPEKRERQVAGDDLAFIDRDGFPVMMKRLEADFQDKFAKAKASQTDLKARLATFAFLTETIDPTARYILYSHGRIIEDQGIPAHSSRFGPYEYVDILETFREAGFIVFSEPRGLDPDVVQNADALKQHIQRLLETGVPADHITLIGASKGAYIASLASHNIQNSDINLVLLAGCSSGVVSQMLEADMDIYGRVLTVRDSTDTEFSGSCDPIFNVSSGVVESKEVVTHTNLAHGLIYTPHKDWVEPVLEWARE